jgi:hypothetical protein
VVAAIAGLHLGAPGEALVGPPQRGPRIESTRRSHSARMRWAMPSLLSTRSRRGASVAVARNAAMAASIDTLGSAPRLTSDIAASRCTVPSSALASASPGRSATTRASSVAAAARSALGSRPATTSISASCERSCAWFDSADH